jgi:hypothetical protein
VGVIVTNSPVQQFDFEPLYDQYRIFLQSNVSYTPLYVKQETWVPQQQITVGERLQVFEATIRGVYYRMQRFLLPKPTVDFQNDCFFGFRLCDRPEVTNSGLVKKQQPLGDVCNGSAPFQGRYANNLLCGLTLVVAETLLFAYDMKDFVVEYLTSLLVRFRSYLQNNDLRFLVFQPKLHSFDSPVGVI